MSIFHSTPWLQQLKKQANTLVQRSLDQHIQLAVTGLSQSGKTTFITSLVHQLTQQLTPKNLPLFTPVVEQRLLGCQKISQQHAQIPSFPYQAAIDQLLQQQQWPESTRSISEIRLAIRYRSQQSWRQQFSQYHTLYLDIIDYPGEWLLDLLLLEMDYRQFCELSWRLQQSFFKQEEHLQQFIQFDPSASFDEQQLLYFTKIYTDHLLALKASGHNLIIPGRFIMPGELAGAPVLQFFPVDPKKVVQPIPAGSQLAHLEQRFNDYKQHVVKPFYENYFKHFDRQIVLVDILSTLNSGPKALQDLRYSLELIFNHFNFGRNHLLQRLFAPKIDKLLFAVTKADHVTREQHATLTQLLQQLIQPITQQLNYDGVPFQISPLSAVKVTEQGEVEHQDQKKPCLRGCLQTNTLTTLYPGDVPKQWPTTETWPTFQYASFKPHFTAPELSHYYLDRALDYLLGDKLQ